MSKYTTGEIARLCDVTVRTVQYYDTRGLLVPSELSEGGRRLYSEDDLKRMKIICFLRDMDMSIDSISKLLSEEKPENVISILIEQQEALLNAELGEAQSKLNKLTDLKRELKSVDDFSLDSLVDIATVMKNKNNLKKVRLVLILTAIPLELAEIATIVLWVMRGIWLPFVIFMIIAIPCVALLLKYYYQKVSYICPECHTVFKPSFKEFFWANHTPTTRKLTCTSCGHKGFCVETYCDDTAD